MGQQRIRLAIHRDPASCGCAPAEPLRPDAEQCLKSVDRPGKGRTFPGDRIKVPSKTGAVTLVGKVRPMLTVVSDAVDRDGSAAGAALREVFPDTREQRCWFHKIANVLAALPKSAHPGAKKALAEIWNAEDKRHALDAVKTFEAAYDAKFPKAVAKITDDVEQLLAFYAFPAEHWVHLRTTNPIESTFATVRNRSKITKGPGSRAAGIAMAYKLIEAAQSRWRAVNAPHLVALVRAGAKFENGKLVEHPDGDTTTKEAA